MSHRQHPALIPLGLVVTIAGVLAIMSVQPAAAHERREVGEYEFVGGFLNEPAIVEEPNGPDLRITQGGGEAAEPVEGLADTLQAEVIFGEQSMPLELRPAFGQPGAYRAEFIPTAEGAYTFHITGDVNGTAVDERFTSGPDTFSEVEGRAPMSFPEVVAPVGDVAQTVTDTEDTADTAQLVAWIALVVGLLGAGAAIRLQRPAQWRMSRRTEFRMRSRKAWRWLLAAMPLIAIMLSPAAASAHAFLDRSDPEQNAIVA